MVKLAAKHGGKVLSTVYVNCNTELLWECKEGHQFEARPINVKRAQDWCIYCSGKRKFAIEDMAKLAAKHGGKVLSIIYVDYMTKLLWECKEGHQFEATPRSAKKIVDWCNICKDLKGNKGSKGEFIVANIFNKLNIKYTREFSVLSGKWRFDFEFEVNNIKYLLEFDGKQHFVYTSYFHNDSEDVFEISRNTDKSKTKWVINQGYYMIRIDYTQIGNIRHHLLRALQSRYNDQKLYVTNKALYEYIM